MSAAADLGLGAVELRVGVLRVGVAPAARTPVRRHPALELVAPGRGDARRAPFVAIVVSLLVAGLLGLLGLNTVLAQDAFTLHTLTVDGGELADREQLLQREVEALRAPDAIASRAVALGMVQAGAPAFLRLPDGALLGAVTPELDAEALPR